MNCAQGFANDALKECLEMGLISGLVCAAVIFGIIQLFGSWDKDFGVKMKCRDWVLLTLFCMFMGAWVAGRCYGNRKELAEGLVMLVYLAVCSITDHYMQQVYDVFQLYVCSIVGGFALCTEVKAALGAELLILALLQGGLFLRMYGEADAMGFLVCALSLLEGGLLIWTIHMAVTFLLLGIVQGRRGNIALDGNLKVSVPLFPYMAAAYAFVF